MYTTGNASECKSRNPQANGAQGEDNFDSTPLVDPQLSPELMDLLGTLVAAAQPPAAATPQPKQQAAPPPQQQPQPQPTAKAPPPTIHLSVDDENRLIDRLLSSLQEMGIAQPRPTTPVAAQQQEPETTVVQLPTGSTIESVSQPERENEEDPWSNWNDPWNPNQNQNSGNNWNDPNSWQGSNQNWNWNSGNWQSHDWSGDWGQVILEARPLRRQRQTVLVACGLPYLQR